jgi:hypothetical protein
MNNFIVEEKNIIKVRIIKWLLNMIAKLNVERIERELVLIVVVKIFNSIKPMLIFLKNEKKIIV